jgi:hypothetical protein
MSRAVLDVMPESEGLSAKGTSLRDALACLRGNDTPGAERALAAALGPNEKGWLSASWRLTEQAEAMTASLDWTNAHLVYEILVASGRARFDWIRDRLAWRAAHLTAFLDRFEKTPAIDRLRDFLEKQLGRPVDRIETARLKPGFVGMAIYRHRIAFADGGPPLAMIEKVLSAEARDTRRVRHEQLLFTSMPAEDLLAPPYYGVLAEGDFVSCFQGFFPGEPLALDLWIATQADLLYRYWMMPPPPKLAKGPFLGPHYLDQLRRIIAKDVPKDVKRALRAVSLDEAAETLRGRSAAVEAAIVATPVFVFHDDLHCGNILVDGAGGMAIIDWDNWALAPLGTGWCFYSTAEEIPPIDIERIRAARVLPPEIGQRELMLMAALWGWNKALRDSKPDLAARWLEKLVRYA